MPTLRSRKTNANSKKLITLKRRILPTLIFTLFSFLFFTWSCSKLDTTSLGAEVLPVVDNVNTFADTLNILTTQGVFNPDTTALARTGNFVFGYNNDPLFGTTRAGIYFQMKPTFFPFYFGAYNDTLNGFGAGLDSVVLCLSYKGFYGDSSTPLHVEVREVTDAGFRDSVYNTRNVNYQPVTGQILGTADINVARLGDIVHYTNGKDSSFNQVRINLSAPVWKAFLYSCDTLNTGPFRHAFKSDSTYRNAFNGLAVTFTQGSLGNELIYTSLSDVSSKLEVHFRRRNNGKVDTIYNALVLNSDKFGTVYNNSSAVANYIQRNRPGLPNGNQEIFLQTSPGTFANLSIPALSTMPNRIIHRAELIVTQIPEIPQSPFFKSPSFLYLDLQDSITPNKWKPIYHDLNPTATYDPDFLNPLAIPFYPSSNVGIDYLYFGCYKKNKPDQFGNPVDYYNMNITRYVQDIVTLHHFNYKMRLYAPNKLIYPQYSPAYIAFGNSLAFGRVKVGGGGNTNGYKMMLRVVYSKL